MNKLRSMKKHCRRLRASRWLPLSRRLQLTGFVLQPRFSTVRISAKERVSLSGQGQLFFRCKEISDASFEKCDLMQARGKKQWLIKADFFSRSLSAMRRPAVSQVHFTPDKRFLFFLLYRPCRVDRLLSVPSSLLR